MHLLLEKNLAAYGTSGKEQNPQALDHPGGAEKLPRPDRKLARRRGLSF